jgi:hypothetical protein
MGRIFRFNETDALHEARPILLQLLEPYRPLRDLKCLAKVSLALVKVNQRPERGDLSVPIMPVRVIKTNRTGMGFD